MLYFMLILCCIYNRHTHATYEVLYIQYKVVSAFFYVLYNHMGKLTNNTFGGGRGRGGLKFIEYVLFSQGIILTNFSLRVRE